MLRYFRINDPYRLLGLLVLFTLLCLALFIDAPPLTLPELQRFLTGEKVANGFSLYTEIIDTLPPAAAWFNGALYWLAGRSLLADHLLAFFVLFCQAAFLGIILIDKKAFPENTYVPSFLFMTLTLVSFDFFSVTADLAAFGFTLLALNNLYKEVEFRTQRDETVFNLGVYISIASLLNFSFAIYLPGSILILALFTRNTLRKYLLLTTGFMLPHLVLITIAYYRGHADAWWTYYYLHGLSFTSVELLSFKTILVLGAIPLLFLLVSLFILNRDAHLTKYQSQLTQVMFLWLLVGLIHVLITDNLRAQSLIVLIPSLSFFFTHFLLLIRRRKFAEISCWILLTGMATVFYLSRYGYLESVDYSSLAVAEKSAGVNDKKILNLSEEESVYRTNTVSPPLTDATLRTTIFSNPDFYDHVLLVDKLFGIDPPDIIIDPENKMKPFLQRLPAMEKQYKKTTIGYERVVASD